MQAQDHAPLLIVEDSPEDFQAMARAFQKVGLRNPICHCETGDQALDFLHRRMSYNDPAESALPGLILLDLNLPGTDGHGVLHAVKQSRVLKHIPVVVFTSSNDERDIQGCYDAGANSYVRKPGDLPGFVRAIQQISRYWFGLVVIPPPLPGTGLSEGADTIVS